MNILIIGCTSNICKIRVFKNLSYLHESIRLLYCLSDTVYSQIEWKKYIQNLNITDDRFLDKLIYIQSNYNYSDYYQKLKFLFSESLYIYVSTPPICYPTIIEISKHFSKVSLILEKPLAINYQKYLQIQPLLTGNILMIDHFLFKKDIQYIIHHYKDRDISHIHLKFHYQDNVEDRLGYFDKTGFFLDMFQSHFLSILYLLIKNNLGKIFNSSISIVRKQYENYGGKNKEADTYFKVTIINQEYTIILEAGKAMKFTEKCISVNHEKNIINDYQDEYMLYFKNIDKGIYEDYYQLISKQELFWKITEHVKKFFKPITFYHNKLL